MSRVIEATNHSFIDCSSIIKAREEITILLDINNEVKKLKKEREQILKEMGISSKLPNNLAREFLNKI